MADSTRPAGPAPRGGAVLRRHAGLLAVLALGALLRVAVAVSYPQAFLFADSFWYERYSRTWVLDPLHQAGYAWFIRLLRELGDLAVLTGVQHALGLALGVLVYALLLRRGVPRWTATVAAALLVLDPRQLTLEHYVLAETLFTTLLLAAFAVLLWPDRPGWPSALAGGTLFALAVATRAVALPTVVLVLGYLLVRRAGWRAVTAALLGMAAVLGGYATAFHSTYDRYSLSGYQGHFLYGRTASIANCQRLDLPADLQQYCPHRHPAGVRADWYLWVGGVQWIDHSYDPELQRFSVEVIRQQPLGYLHAGVRDTLRFFGPMPTTDDDYGCLAQYWRMPGRTTPRVCVATFGETAGPDERYAAVADPTPATTRLTRKLHWYSHRGDALPVLSLDLGLLLSLIATAVAAGRAVRRRRRGPATRSAAGRPVRVPDVLFLAGTAAALLTVAAFTSLYDPRYSVPAAPLLAMAGALSWQYLRGQRTPEPAAASGTAAAGPQVDAATAAAGDTGRPTPADPTGGESLERASSGGGSSSAGRTSPA